MSDFAYNHKETLKGYWHLRFRNGNEEAEKDAFFQMKLLNTEVALKMIDHTL